MRPHHNPFIQNMMKLLMGLVAVCWSVCAFAADPADAADQFRRVCATAKGHPDRAATEDELRDCYDKNLVEHHGLTVDLICNNLFPNSSGIQVIPTPEPAKPAAPAKPPSPPKPTPPKPLTAEEKCHKEGKVFVPQPAPDVFGNPSGLTQNVCIGLKELAERVLKLEQIIHNLPPANPASAPAQPPTPVQQEALHDAEINCPAIPDMPHATPQERCRELLNQTNGMAQIAQSRADAAYGLATRAHERLNDLVTGRTRMPPSFGRHPHLMVSGILPMHLRNDFREKFVGSGGAQIRALLDLTPDLQFVFLGGGGLGFGTDDKGFVGSGGIGLMGPIETDDVFLEGVLLLEHRFRREPLTFFGPRLEIGYIPGEKNRKGFELMPGIGLAGAVGRSFGQTPAGTNDAYTDGVITLDMIVVGL